MRILHARVVDATHLELHEPIPATQGQHVVLSVSEPGEIEDDREAWLALSAEDLARAYEDDEPEYPATLVKEPNPQHQG